GGCPCAPGGCGPATRGPPTRRACPRRPAPAPASSCPGSTTRSTGRSRAARSRTTAPGRRPPRPRRSPGTAARAVTRSSSATRRRSACSSGARRTPWRCSPTRSHWPTRSRPATGSLRAPGCRSSSTRSGTSTTPRRSPGSLPSSTAGSRPRRFDHTTTVSVLERIEAHVRGNELIAPGGEVLCLVSGGADSTCLVLALRELGYRADALHVDHGLRGDESAGDARFCAEALGAEIVAAPGAGLGEAALRNLRYAQRADRLRPT